MRQPKRSRILSSLSFALAFSGCASIPSRGPHVQICVVQELRGGIECAMKDETQVFLRWDEIKEKFLSGFNRFVITPGEDYVALVNYAHRKK